MGKIKEWLIYGCLISFLILIGLMNGIDETKYCYDSLEYFYGSRSFWNENNFLLTNYSISYRGVWFPLILCGYQWIGAFLGLESWISILIGNSIFVTSIFYFIIPRVLEKKEGILFRVLPLLIYMAFWSDTIYYPLSDIYSLSFVVLAVYIMKEMSKKQYFLFAGMLLYCAYNIRSIYIFVISIIFVIYFIMNIKSEGKKSTLFINIVAIIAGMIILAIPQCVVNEKLHNSFSPFVITDDLNGGEIFTSQLYMGFIYDRYDSFIGELSEYPVPQLGLIDKAGTHILAKEQIDGFDSIWDFVRLVLKYPFDYVGIIIRHVFNALYLPYPSIYVKSITGNKMFWAFLNWILICYFVVVLKYKKKMKQYILSNALYLTTLVPCIAILPGAIESRFFIPMYVFIYYTIASENVKTVYNNTKGKRIEIIVASILFIMISIGVCGVTMSSAQWLPILL